MAPSTQTLLVFGVSATVPLLIWIWDIKRGKAKLWEGGICLLIILILAAILLPLYVSQKPREDNAQWNQEHPRLKIRIYE